jgi:hypothetical protein
MRELSFTDIMELNTLEAESEILLVCKQLEYHNESRTREYIPAFVEQIQTLLGDIGEKKQKEFVDKLDFVMAGFKQTDLVRCEDLLRYVKPGYVRFRLRTIIEYKNKKAKNDRTTRTG